MIRLPEPADNPMTIFQEWLKDAEKTEHSYPNAFTLATTGANGQPAARMLLLKGFDENGFVFYTNTESRKGDDLRANTKAAMLFYWKSLLRQIRIEGTVENVTPREADEYFATRPRGSQIGAWASQQSRPMDTFKDLQDSVAACEKKFTGQDNIPRPPHWTGYRLIPASIEFWIEGDFRLHHRHLYKKNDNNTWSMSLLNP